MLRGLGYTIPSQRRMRRRRGSLLVQVVADRKAIAPAMLHSGGTTAEGGIQQGTGCGIGFSLTPPVPDGKSWAEDILRTFTGGENDSVSAV